MRLVYKFAFRLKDLENNFMNLQFQNKIFNEKIQNIK